MFSFVEPDAPEAAPSEASLPAGIDALFEEDDDVAAEEPAAPEPMPTPDDDISDEDLENLFDEDDAPGAIESIVDSGGTDDDGSDTENIFDADDIEEPDDLPESLTADLDDDDMPVRRRSAAKPEKKGRKGLIITIVLLALLSGIGAGLFFLRGMVVEFVPAMNSVYHMIGLDTGSLGEGLEIKNVNSERAIEGGIDLLIVSGNVANISGGTKPVPLVKALLVGADGEEIQSVVQEPERAELNAGDVIGFSIKVEEPSPLARRLEVTFAPRQMPEDG